MKEHRDPTKSPDAAATVAQHEPGKQTRVASQVPTEDSGPAGDVDSNNPVAGAVFPFDRAPKTTAGEQILFGATYTHAQPGNYKLVYTSVGGDFDTKGSGTATKTIPGLRGMNVAWFIDAAWNGVTPVSMKLEVQLASDSSVIATTNWAFSKKPYHPTTIVQRETEGERDMPAVYSYKVGPSLNSGGDDYIGFTILEKFAGSYRTNLKLTDLKPAYVQQAGLASDDAIAPHFFPGTGSNGTFTPSRGDLIFDQHAGIAGMANARAQLVAPKDFEKVLTQSYESEPGTALETYEISRVMKADGSSKMTKKKA